MNFTVLSVSPDGGPMEGAPVLEPFENSVLEKSLDGGPNEGMPVLEPLEHSVLVIALDGGPMEGAPVLEPIEHSVLKKSLDGGPMDCSLIEMTVSSPLEHSDCIVAVHVDIDSLWMEPWDAGGTLSSSYRSGVAVWRAVLCSVVRLSHGPVLSATGFSRLFRLASEGHAFWTTGVPAEILGNDPQMAFPRSPLSPTKIVVTILL